MSEQKQNNPIITIEMENGGVIKAELYPELAPNTVNNFISLIKKEFYNGCIFHRVISVAFHHFISFRFNQQLLSGKDTVLFIGIVATIIAATMR